MSINPEGHGSVKQPDRGENLSQSEGIAIRLGEDRIIVVSEEVGLFASEIFRQGRGYASGIFPSWFSGASEGEVDRFNDAGFFDHGRRLVAGNETERVKELFNNGKKLNYYPGEYGPFWLTETPTADSVNVTIAIVSAYHKNNPSSDLGSSDLFVRLNLPNDLFAELLTHSGEVDFTRELIRTLYPQLIAAHHTDFSFDRGKKICLFAPDKAPAILRR